MTTENVMKLGKIERLSFSFVSSPEPKAHKVSL